MICKTLDCKSPKALLFVSDSFREGKNIDKRGKWQVPPRVVEASHENFYSGTDSDSEDSDKEVSDQDLILDREIVASQETSKKSTESFFPVQELKKNLKLTH